MIHVDSIVLDTFVNENKDFFENARVQKIQQPTRKEVIIQLRNNHETKKLYININPSFYHVCFMSKKNEKKRNITIPKQPPMFCMLLRKHMEGAKIIKVQKPEYERIIELYFENYNELGDRIEECLSIELMGKHSNIVLYNTDNNIIIGCAHNVGEEKSKERELAGGLPYIYPPKQDKKDIRKTRFDWFKNYLNSVEISVKIAINSKYFGLSQALIEEICNVNNICPDKISSSLDEEEIQKLFIALHELPSNPQYFVSEDKSIFSFLSNQGRFYNAVNDMIDDYFSYHIERILLATKKKNVLQKIAKELKKYKNTLKNHSKQLDKKEKIQTYLNKGNLLTANAYIIENGLNQVVLNDFDTGDPISIELDETKTVIENAQKYFTLYNKGKKAIQVAENMCQQLTVEIEFLNQLIFEIEICQSIDELTQISEVFEPEKTQITNNKKKEQNIIIEKREIDGFVVYIGKNHKQNDYLYSKISSHDDLWFHIYNAPGAHIIAKSGNVRQTMSDETLLKIAMLAKEYSTAKNSLKASVIYTQRKYIKRPQNTKSGLVVYKNETEIVVN